MRRTSEKVILDIEFLRAVAIVFTLVHHLPFLLFWKLEWFQHLFQSAVFWSGVDLFFCISGFVIMRSFRTQHLDRQTEKRTLYQIALPFWLRRAWRLWPTAWLWLLVPLCCTLWLNQSGVFGEFFPMLSDAGAAFVHLANFHWIGCLFYGTGSCNMDGTLLIIYWSLSLEEQFYLLFPILIFLTPRKYLPHFLMLLVVAQLFITRPYLTPGWVIRTDALLLGVLIALWQGSHSYRSLEPVFMRARLGSAAIVGMLLFLLMYVPSERLGLGAATGGLAIISAVLVWIASYGKNYLCPHEFLRSISVWLGSRSYSLYLIHLVAFALTREFWSRIPSSFTIMDDGRTLLFLLTAGALMFVLVELNYRFVESPLRNKGRKIAEGYKNKAI